MAGNETSITRRIQVAVSRMARGIVTFRNNTGQGWQGEIERGRAGAIIIREPRPLQAGLCEGSSDLIGWLPVEVTPAMVGRRLALFVALEVKTPAGRTSDEQRNFIAAVKAAGGVAGVVRSEDDARRLLEAAMQ